VDRGADFVALVREHSEDAASKAKDGDFGTFRRSDKIPEPIKAAIFSLRPGEVSRPVRQPNGFYLFRVEELKTPTLDDVRQELIPAAKTAKFTEWFEGVRASIRVEFENEEYFTGGPAR
jgi:peptidyl-prolyl cis-trans isomerase C